MTTSSNNHSLEIETNDNYEKTTMQSLYDLLGFHYYKTRAVFNVDGKELVYVNDNLFGRANIYLDGDEIYKGWTWLPGMVSDITVNHQGHEYRVFSRVYNWISWAQKITVIVDDSKAQSKVDPVLGGLGAKALAHAIGGALALGGFAGFVASLISS